MIYPYLCYLIYLLAIDFWNLSNIKKRSTAGPGIMYGGGELIMKDFRI